MSDNLSLKDSSSKARRRRQAPPEASVTRHKVDSFYRSSKSPIAFSAKSKLPQSPFTDRKPAELYKVRFEPMETDRRFLVVLIETYDDPAALASYVDVPTSLACETCNTSEVAGPDWLSRAEAFEQAAEINREPGSRNDNGTFDWAVVLEASRIVEPGETRIEMYANGFASIGGWFDLATRVTWPTEEERQQYPIEHGLPAQLETIGNVA